MIISELFSGWFEHDGEKTQHVYVSGLPNDITDDEFSELMAKCGLIMYDPFNNKPKLKLYKDSEGKPKGDGLCCYIKVKHLLVHTLPQHPRPESQSLGMPEPSVDMGM